MNFSDRGSRFRPLVCGLWLVLLGVAFLGSRPGDAQAGKAEHEIKIATLAPDGSTWMNLMRELDRDIRTKTGNAVGLRFYPGGIQGDEPIVLRKIRTGQLHGGGLTGVGLGEIAPNLRVMELPFLFENEEEIAAVHQTMDPVFEAELESAGFTLLGWAEVGFVYLYSKKPIRSASDLKSQKLWLWEGDPLAEAFIRQAGVSPVPLSITDVMTSLQTGLISAVYVSPLACIALQWFTRVSYTTSIPITHALGAVVITNKAWNKVPEQHHPTIRSLCDKYFGLLQHATLEENKRSMEVIAESGVGTIRPSDEDTEALRLIGDDVAEHLVGRLYSREVLDSVAAALDSWRSKHSGQSSARPD